MSPLVAAQAEFLHHVAKLLEFAWEQGYFVTLGEGYRTREQQEIHFRTGRSKTMDSQHMKRLAIDLHFFKDGRLTYDYPELGAYWESLHPKNRWGGNFKSFKDTPHFERRD